MKKKFRLNRRAFLAGLGGTVIGLPIMEAMLDQHGEVFAADGEEIPKRYIIAFGGHSLGAEGDEIRDMFTPNNLGANYDLKRALEPIGEAGVQEHVSVISNLEIDWAKRNGGSTPPGGRHDGFHLASLSPLLSGVRSSTDGRTVRGITSDQVVANAIAINANRKSLHYRVQASWYLDVSAPYGRDAISYKGDGDPIDAVVSPSQAFSSLFSGFMPPDPADAAQVDFLLRGRKSVLDMVRKRYEALLPNLSGYDKQILERHFDEIRAIELRVQDIAPQMTEICQVPSNPGMDPDIGGNNSGNGQGDEGYNQNAGYSDEESRARVFTDILHMAMACQITNVASLQYTMAQSHMNMYSLTGVPWDLHEVGHASGDTTKVSECIAWHTKHWARLVQKFADTEEAGKSMLDNSAIIYLCEGGKGYDPEGDRNQSTHSTENMAMLVAGHVGGLNAGQHIDGKKNHPVKALISCMKAVGVETDELGEVSGELPDLRS